MFLISWHEWILAGSGTLLMIAYHIYLYLRVKRYPLSTSIGITNHARKIWVEEIRKDRHDILAVQTIRNQMMAATFLASTSIIISLGSFGAAFRPGTFLEVSHFLNYYGTKTETLWMFKLMLLGILFFYTFFNFTLAMRYYNHTGFMINTYNQNDTTISDEAVTQIINHAALHYTIGMRGFYLSIPMALWMFGPIWMLCGSIAMVMTLYRLDQEA